MVGAEVELLHCFELREGDGEVRERVGEIERLQRRRGGGGREREKEGERREEEKEKQRENVSLISSLEALGVREGGRERERERRRERERTLS